MAKAKHTYAVRLAVEGGNKVKAELVNVGESGERSLKKIERAGGKASRGLSSLGERARTLTTGMRALGGALVGAAAVGGLATLIDQSISAADAIGKTADKLGVGIEALQELRFAAQLAGVQQQTLDMGLQRFTRRVAEAAKGTGEAKQALTDMGIALRDQHGNIRRTEDGGYTIDVIDSGIGIDAEELSAIFDPFHQINSDVLIAKNDGIGLGLTLVKAIMELHNGSIEIESVPNEGTTASLKFPPERIVQRNL